MKLPNSENAFIDLRKLEEYCLNPSHPRGKHKAKVFLSALGLTQDNAEELKTKILKEVPKHSARVGLTDQFGVRYIVDFEWNRIGKKAAIRTAWMIRTAEEAPRLVSCMVLPKEEK